MRRHKVVLVGRQLSGGVCSCGKDEKIRRAVNELQNFVMFFDNSTTARIKQGFGGFNQW